MPADPDADPPRTRSSPRPGRVVAWCFASAVVVGTLAILLWPGRVDGDGRAVYRLAIELHRIGVPYWVDYSFLQRGANVALFAVLGGAAAAVLPRRLWWVAAVGGTGLSAAAEVAQLFLSRRQASLDDLLMNGLGALLGAAVVAAVRLGLARRSRRRRGAERSSP